MFYELILFSNNMKIWLHLQINPVYFLVAYVSLISILFTDGKDLSDWLSAAFDEDTMDCYNKRLAVGAVIAEEMRAAVYSDTGFRCSAGIAHNKVMFISIFWYGHSWLTK
jgi:nucleotidyltransferase/DNA polymerase involved in DNA repair